MLDPSHPDAALAALITFYQDAGIDCALAEEPCDRFAEEATRRAQAPARQSTDAADMPGARRAPVVPQDLQPAPANRSQPGRTRSPQPGSAIAAADPREAEAGARALAEAAQDLAELEQRLAAFEGCALKATAKSLVFADGRPGSRVMLVGEAPGSEEDRQGKPFVGRSGQLLDRMLAAIGLDRDHVYIANVVPWRPPGNRTPTPQEVAVCLPFIRRQIELANPDFLICLGGPAGQTLLGIREGILKARGRWREYETGKRTIPAMASLHPAYLLRQPLQKRLAWRDLRALRKALEGG
jgi:uracil-DNA glycosylase family 4